MPARAASAASGADRSPPCRCLRREDALNPLLAGPDAFGHAGQPMRTAGTLLTVLALLLAQAPWIACTCDGAAALRPLLTGVFGHGDAEHDADHPHHCCDGVAHAVHGADHAHGRDCHGRHSHETFSHTHDDGSAPCKHHEAPQDEEPDKPTERHDGFRIALRTLPADVDLEASLAAPAFFDACLAAGLPGPFEAPALWVAAEPPERSNTPRAATERRLL